MITLDIKRISLALFIGVTFAACGENDDSVGVDLAEEPCGIRVCTEADISDYEPANLGVDPNAKADTQGVELAIRELGEDGVLDIDDVRRVFEEAGGRISDGEIRAIRAGVKNPDVEVTEDALELTYDLAVTANLPADEAEEILSGRTFAGTEVPETVTELLREARLAGAVAYDVNEQNSDGEGIWSPYPATTPAIENMAFAYTEITPQALAADIEDTDVEYNRIVGAETATTSWGQEYQQARYEAGVGGTGNILAHYDEVYHPDIFARGRSGQKWANNVAIMSDGTIHCLPASRRSPLQDLILTNPHLSRGKHLLYNGHLDVRDGVVTGIEMSGRLSKRAAKGKAMFINPIALLEAWGFEMSPNLSLRYGNTSDGVPVIDEETGLIVQDPAQN